MYHHMDLIIVMRKYDKSENDRTSGKFTYGKKLGVGPGLNNGEEWEMAPSTIQICKFMVIRGQIHQSTTNVDVEDKRMEHVFDLKE